MRCTTQETRTVSFPRSRSFEKHVHYEDGLSISCVDAGTAGIFISARVTKKLASETSAHRLYEIVSSLLKEKNAVLVHERVFASISCSSNLLLCREKVLSAVGLDPNTPVTFIQGYSLLGEGVAGSLFHAVHTNTARVETLYFDTKPLGRRWSTAYADYLILQISGNAEKSSAFDVQADELFDTAANLFAQQGFSFTDVVRTWFYIRDILTRYQTFNSVRDRRYAEFGLMSKSSTQILLPASTGIEGSAVNGSALAGDILAVKPKSKNNVVRRLSNPTQKEAFNYGASFSRGTIIEEQGVEFIQVSGTASIGENGQTLYPGDGASQISCTLDKLEALLQTASAGLDHIVTANIFVKNSGLAELFQKIAKTRGLSDFPGVPVIADICRDDLLFEIDAEVIVPKEEKVCSRL